MNIPAVSAVNAANPAPAQNLSPTAPQANAPSDAAAVAESSLPTAPNQRAFGTLNAFDTPASQKAKLNFMAKELIDESAVATGERRNAIKDDLRQVWNAMGYAAQEQFAAANVIVQSLNAIPSLNDRMAQLATEPSLASSGASTGRAGVSAEIHLQAVPATQLATLDGNNASGDAIAAMGGQVPSAALAAPPAAPLATVPENAALATSIGAPGAVGQASSPPQTTQTSSVPDGTSPVASGISASSSGAPAPEISDLTSPPPGGGSGAGMQTPAPSLPSQSGFETTPATRFSPALNSASQGTPPAAPELAPAAAVSLLSTSAPLSVPAAPPSQTPAASAASATSIFGPLGTAPAGLSISTHLAGGADPDVAQWRAVINVAAAAQQVPANLLGGMLFEHGQGLVTHSGLPTGAWNAAPEVQQAHQKIIAAMKAELPQSFVGVAGEAQNVMGVAARLKQDYNRLGSWELATHSYIAAAAQAVGEPSGTPLEDVAHSTTRVLAWWRGLSTGQQLSPSHNPASIR